MHPLRNTIVGLFLVQLASGVVLMTAYSPSIASAWNSVWYIQSQSDGGWFIRGVHHFASDAMLILFVAAIAKALLTRVYQAVGWKLWWTLLIGLGLTLVSSLTGHLLPWDQEGFWGTTVRANILAKTPYVGETLRRLLFGGNDLGELTLTRFHTLHVVILPLSLALLCRFQTQTWERQRPDQAGEDTDIAPPRRRDQVGSAVPGTPPEAAIRAVGGAVLFAATILCIALTTYLVCRVGGSTLLDAPADHTATDYPARPEWHTLFLFEWLKFFQGPTAEVVGAVVIPSIFVAIFFAFPWFHRVLSESRAHRAAVGIAAGIALGMLTLTGVNRWHDRNPSDAAVAAVRLKQSAKTALTDADQAILRARQFNVQRAQAASTARRALELAATHGIPPQGPLALLAADPALRGPKLFAANCASCHRYDGHNGIGEIPADPPTSSDLKGFASREWIRGLLENPMSDRFFGKMRTPQGEPAHTRMDRFVRERREGADDAARAQVTAEFDAVAAFLSEQSRPDVHRDKGAGPAESQSVAMLAQGRDLFMTVCNECHTYGGERTGTTRAPEMQGYGSVDWLKLMIAEPDHETRYRAAGRERARMPRFKEKLSEQEIAMLAQWIAKDR